MGRQFRPTHCVYLLQFALAVVLMSGVFATTITLHVLQCVFALGAYHWSVLVIYTVLYVPLISLTMVFYYRTSFADVWLPDHIDRVCHSGLFPWHV